MPLPQKSSFWPERAPLPGPVRNSVVLGSGVAVLTAFVSLSNNRVDVTILLLFLAFGGVFANAMASWLWAGEVRAAWKRRTFEKVAVGFSTEVGAWGVLYGVAVIVFMVGFSLVPAFFPGLFPSYAVAADRAFVVLFVSPLQEESLFAGAWSVAYNSTGRPVAAHGITAFAFAGYHSAVYSGAGPFVFVYLFVMRFAISVADWEVRKRGGVPSTVPGIVAHMGLNFLNYVPTCILGVVKPPVGVQC